MSTALIRPSTLYAWKGPSLLITNTRGDCDDDQRLSGFYFREARFLRTLSFEIDGERPWLAEAASIAPAVLTFTYVHSEAEHHVIPQRALAIRASYTTQSDGLVIAITVANHSKAVVTCELAWTLDADFADIQEAQDGRRQQDADVERHASDIGVTFAYQHDRLRYRSTVTVTTHADWSVAPSRIATRVTLEPHASIDLGLRVEASGADGSPVDGDADSRERTLEEWRNRFARVTIPGNRIAEQIVRTNIRDFASFPLLEGQPDEWLTLQAGMPLYPAMFGRDTMTAGWQAARIDRGASLDASLTRLGRLQSRRRDDWRDEEPGRIPYH